MATIVDSYSETYRTSFNKLRNGGITAFGQSFTPSQGGTLDSCKFSLLQLGVAPGNIVAKVYAHSGTYGTNGVPTGAALATSDAVVASSISTGWGLVTFTFSGANRITLTQGTHYVVIVDYAGNGDLSNCIEVGIDTSTVSHGGNYCQYTSSWSGSSGWDVPFYVYAITSTAYSLVAAYTTFTLTGKNSLFSWGRKLVATSYRFFYDTFVATLKVVRKVIAEAGSFTLTGQTTVIGFGRKMLAGVGSFTYSAFDVIYGHGRGLVADVVSFTLTGEDSILASARKLAAAVASFTLTGEDSLFALARRLMAEVGTFTLTGIEAALRYGKKMVATTVAFVLGGQDLIFQLNRVLRTMTGSFTAAGTAVRLLIDGSIFYFPNKYSKRNTSSSDKYSTRGTSASDKYSPRSTTYTDKYPRP